MQKQLGWESTKNKVFPKKKVFQAVRMKSHRTWLGRMKASCLESAGKEKRPRVQATYEGTRHSQREEKIEW